MNLTEAAIRSGVDIVLVGKSFENRNNLSHPELRDFSKFLEKYSGLPKVHIKGFVEQIDLVSLINLADIFLFPSFYEGFGLPILEAQSCGVPVITSNNSSIPEVGGKSVMYVDPYNPDAISLAITRIISSEKLREDLIKNGFENIKRFSWEKTAKETVEVYEKVLGN